MNWSDISKTVGGIAPLLGTLLGGPAGAAIGGLVSTALGVANTPDAVSQAIAANPGAAAALIQTQADNKVKLQELVVSAEKNRLDAETAATTAVNTTMQAETKSDHWPTYTWRPFVGFAFGLMGLIGGVTAAAAYCGVMFFGVQAAVLSMLPGLLSAEAMVMATMAPILGIASWFRGQMQSNDPSPSTDKRG